MDRVLPAETAVLLELELPGRLLLVLRRHVIAARALAALQRDVFPHRLPSSPARGGFVSIASYRYSMISVTVPAP